ncbi:hypothetical protein KMT30_06150 [Streptomyces sp. IBSBF 2953]|nr:hypothetical protein [Streptomyces hayashii]
MAGDHPTLWPAVRRALVEDAYRRSFHTTLNTIAAHGQGSTGPVTETAAPTSRSGTPSPA